MEKRGNRFKDLTGMNFGKLDVIRLDRVENKKITWWLCKCQECGREKSIRGGSLRSFQTTQCGCGRGQPIIIEVGQRFDRLVVREIIGRKAVCDCDCGRATP